MTFLALQISSSLFAANSKEQRVEPDNNKLLRCRDCHVTVHASCYGITVLPSDLPNWACDKCKAGMVRAVSIVDCFNIENSNWNFFVLFFVFA